MLRVDLAIADHAVFAAPPSPLLPLVRSHPNTTQGQKADHMRPLAHQVPDPASHVGSVTPVAPLYFSVDARPFASFWKLRHTLCDLARM